MTKNFTKSIFHAKTVNTGYNSLSVAVINS